MVVVVCVGAVVEAVVLSVVNFVADDYALVEDVLSVCDVENDELSLGALLLFLCATAKIVPTITATKTTDKTAIIIIVCCFFFFSCSSSPLGTGELVFCAGFAEYSP